MTHDGRAVIDAKARYRSRIAIFCPPHLHSMPSLGGRVHWWNINIVVRFDIEKLFDPENILGILLLILIQYINVTDRHCAAKTANYTQGKPKSGFKVCNWCTWWCTKTIHWSNGSVLYL